MSLTDLHNGSSVPPARTRSATICRDLRGNKLPGMRPMQVRRAMHVSPRRLPGHAHGASHAGVSVSSRARALLQRCCRRADAMLAAHLPDFIDLQHCRPSFVSQVRCRSPGTTTLRPARWQPGGGAGFNYSMRRGWSALQPPADG